MSVSLRAASWLASIGLLGVPTLVFNFDRAAPGTTPVGWSCVTNEGPAAKWEVFKDKTAPTPPYVFAPVSTEAGNWRFPVAILDKPIFQNGEISVRLKPVSGKEHQSGGLVFRFRDANDYYVVRASALENNLVVYKVDGGRWTPLRPKGAPANGWAVHHPVPVNSWSILKVAFKGPVFSVYFNHRRLLQVEDRSYGGPGKVGLWTKGDSLTYFDDFRVAQK